MGKMGKEVALPLKCPIQASSLMLQVLQAYHASVSLSAQGFYKMPYLGMDWESGVGRPSLYYTYGVGCSEVEIDVLTGRSQV